MLCPPQKKTEWHSVFWKVNLLLRACHPLWIGHSECTVYTAASGQGKIRKSRSSSLIRDACKSDFHSFHICFIVIRKWFHLQYNFFGKLVFNYNSLRFHYFYFTPRVAHELCMSSFRMFTVPRSDEVYSIQHYVIKFVSNLRQVGGFSGYSDFFRQ